MPGSRARAATPGAADVSKSSQAGIFLRAWVAGALLAPALPAQPLRRLPKSLRPVPPSGRGHLWDGGARRPSLHACPMVSSCGSPRGRHPPSLPACPGRFPQARRQLAAAQARADACPPWTPRLSEQRWSEIVHFSSMTPNPNPAACTPGSSPSHGTRRAAVCLGPIRDTVAPSAGGLPGHLRLGDCQRIAASGCWGGDLDWSPPALLPRG